MIIIILIIITVIIIIIMSLTMMRLCMLSKTFGMLRTCSVLGFIGHAVSSIVISFFMTARLKRVRWAALAPSRSLMMTRPWITICSSPF